MKKIILVEETDAILDSISMALRSHGYEVTIYSDAHGILEGDYSLPDIFIIDKQLPGVSGLELCNHLKSQSHTRHIPVIIISASPRSSQLAINAGADAFIEKPLKLNDLRQIVAKLTADN